MVRVSIITTRASDMPSGADNHSTLPKASLIQQPTIALRTCPPVASMMASPNTGNMISFSESPVSALDPADYTFLSDPSLYDDQHKKHHKGQGYP